MLSDVARRREMKHLDIETPAPTEKALVEFMRRRSSRRSGSEDGRADMFEFLIVEST